MAKITDDKKLPLGVGLEPSHVQGNLQKVADSFSASTLKDQRAQAQAPFSVSWCLNVTRGTVGTTEDDQIHFTLPPLQTHWDDSGLPPHQVTNEQTPAVTLDSISLGFDLMNQDKSIDASTALPSTADMGNVTLRLFKLDNDPSTTDPPPFKTIVAEIQIFAEDIVAQLNTKNPTILRDLGLSIDRLAVYEWQLESADLLLSVLIRATFLHPLEPRDTALVIGNALNGGVPLSAQNAPATALYNLDPGTVTLTAPAPDALIEAASATTGVQTQIETIDTVFRNKLVGGRADHLQSDVAFATDRKEQLAEDSGYFCMCVNLLKSGETGGYITAANATSWQVATGATTNALWDRALIPITYPGTIHHVFVEMAGINEHMRKNPGTIPITTRTVEVGVGLYRGVRTASIPTYQQVAHLSTGIGGTTGRILKERMWQVPLVWSSASTAMGKGYVDQGRPVYFGRQLTYDGTVNRETIADIVGSSAAEAVATTQGLENFIEVRVQYMRGSGASWVTGGGATDLVLTNAGINVYIIGKMGLKE